MSSLTTRDEKESSTGRKSVFMMPFPRNPMFTGRAEFLSLLRETLFDQTPKQFNYRVGIYGMAGIGKTEVAVEFVHRYRTSYDCIYWISALDQASLLSGYQSIAGEHRLALNENDPIEIAHFVLRWLAHQENWLLVLDNLDDISVLSNRLLPPKGPGQHTLMTTRNPNTEGIPAEGMEVPILGQFDAMTLLTRHAQIPLRPG